MAEKRSTRSAGTPGTANAADADPATTPGVVKRWVVPKKRRPEHRQLRSCSLGVQSADDVISGEKRVRGDGSHGGGGERGDGAARWDWLAPVRERGGGEGQAQAAGADGARKHGEKR
jgi:hypothetical protein